MICTLCPRRCSAQRDAESGSGFCRMPETMHVALISLHMWEEPPISGVNGSGAVFFSGCPLGCAYCQNREISRSAVGKEYTPDQLARKFRVLEEQGAHNINLVTGTHFIPQIIETFRIYRPKVPVVWNSGGYETVEAVDALAPYVDIWLPDYKYGLTEVAAKYSRAPDYPETALNAIMRMRYFQPENIMEGGLLKKGMIIRHLILPANLRNSAAALRRIAAKAANTPVSLMSQYTPVDGIENEFPELGRTLTEREYDRILELAGQLGIDGFTQELSAADSGYVPAWDI